MAEENQSQAADNNQDGVQPPISDKGENIKTEPDEENAQKKCEEPPKILDSRNASNIIVNVPKQSNRAANIIAIVSVSVALVLAFLNWLVYQQIKNQTTSVKTSADAAKQSAEAAKNATSISESALQQIKNQFEAINQPFLQIDKISYLLTTADANMALTYRINNVTQIPIKMIEYRSAFTILDDPTHHPSVDEMKKRLNKKAVNLNLYVTNQSPQDIKTIDRELTQDELRIVATPGGVAWIFIYREIKYQNLVDCKIKTYGFYVQIRSIAVIHPTGVEYELLYSNNY